MRRPAALALIAGCLVASGCGEGGSPSGGAAETGVGQVRAGSVAALAQCRDWLEGGEDERRTTIDDIQAQLNQAGSGGPTPDLPDAQAYELLERACANDYAHGFRLYKLYARAAAFSPLGEQDG